MRLANRQGRAVLLVGDSYFDLERRSDGLFGADVMSALAQWQEVEAQMSHICQGAPDGSLIPADLGPSVPRPRNVFAVGLNYHDHAIESGLAAPDQPMVFTKFPSCLTGPNEPVYLWSDSIDYEVELVVVVGRNGRNIDASEAEGYIAGVTVGQDISDRRLQMSGSPPQFSLGKSLDSFGPLGPAVVSIDELADLNDLHIWCEVDGERVQDSRTGQLIFSPQYLVSYLSRSITLAPGDLIFTGTPAGVGIGFSPARYLAAGSSIRSGIEGVGVMENQCLAASVSSGRL